MLRVRGSTWVNVTIEGFWALHVMYYYAAATALHQMAPKTW